MTLRLQVYRGTVRAEAWDHMLVCDSSCGQSHASLRNGAAHPPSSFPVGRGYVLDLAPQRPCIVARLRMTAYVQI